MKLSRKFPINSFINIRFSYRIAELLSSSEKKRNLLEIYIFRAILIPAVFARFSGTANKKH